MIPLLPPLRLTGACILRDRQMQHRSVAIADGRITRGPLPGVDLSGFLVLPGIIDLHSSGVEAGTGGVPHGLAQLDRQAAAHGATTAYLAQSWSWEGGGRGPDHAEAVMAGLDAYRPGALTDLRLQIRAESHLVDHGARLLEAVRRHRIGYVVFNDHLEDASRQHRADPQGFALRAHQAGVAPQEFLARIESSRACARAVPRHLCGLAEGFDAMGVSYGSHADPDGETREFYAMIGARIAAFPPNRRVAAAAHAMMNPVIMGAPNVVQGGSHAGNIAAVDLIAEGLCDALASNGQPAAPLQAVWALVDRKLASLPQAWAMVSSIPAEIMRLADRGRLDPGLRADLVVICARTRVVEATISGGRLTYATGEAERRFARALRPVQMAAE